jgi:hypothetical protein
VIRCGADRHRKHSTISRKRLPPRVLLCAHWSAKSQRLKELGEISRRIPPVSQDPSPAQQRKRQEVLEEGEGLTLLIRRIGSYLGIEAKMPAITPLKAARNVRGMIEKGCCDEEIAFFLMRWRPTKEEEALLGKKKVGRPIGASIPDDTALRALELHDTDPKQCEWPRVADQLGCKVHNDQKHSWDSSCTVQLKKSVARLRAFLRQLQSS